MKKCVYAGCQRSVHAKDHCEYHYRPSLHHRKREGEPIGPYSHGRHFDKRVGNVERAFMSKAACAEMDLTAATDVFFLDRGENATKAKAICSRCPVKGECLNYVLEHLPRTTEGVWGGTTSRERGDLRRERDLAS